MPDLWKTCKDSVLKTCDEVCGKRSLREIEQTVVVEIGGEG